ncbi:hypothetical protein P4O66_000500 [Electrophorus voltai]|uniref:Uncharacterized protein n=1 Tax=Electrophorus voltai TaxID=2609070 RepID=A0AAD9DWF4_9TELE|nr:hypothetical protein P4O66_000500 [Electrophorus voltai]
MRKSPLIYTRQLRRREALLIGQPSNIPLRVSPVAALLTASIAAQEPERAVQKVKNGKKAERTQTSHLVGWWNRDALFPEREPSSRASRDAGGFGESREDRQSGGCCRFLPCVV